MPGIDQHPCGDILPQPPIFVQEQGSAPATHHLWTSAPSTSSNAYPSPKVCRQIKGRRAWNQCTYCEQVGHFANECKNPHRHCPQCGYCKVKGVACNYPRKESRQLKANWRGAKKGIPTDARDQDDGAVADDYYPEMNWEA